MFLFFAVVATTCTHGFQVFPISFGGGRFTEICRICGLQVLIDTRRHFTITVILDCMQKQRVTAVNEKSVQYGFNLVLGSDHVVLKSEISLSRSFFAVLVVLLMS